jgi:transposase
MSERRAKQERRAAKRRRDLPIAELVGIVERTKAAPLGEADYATLKMAIDTLSFLTEELAARGTTIDRLRRMLFGASTEKTSRVVGEPATGDKKGDAEAGPSAGDAAGAEGKPKPKAPGHGRNGAASYPGAQKIRVAHATLKHGECCPGCAKGKVYDQSEPAVLLRVHGMAPLSATLYEKDRLRCNLCGEVYTAASPPGIGDEKYDETAAAMIGLLKYGAGLPFHRIEKLQAGLGIPLPAATQWDVVERAAESLSPAHEALCDQAAQGELVHNDDTTAKILELKRAPKEPDPDEREGDARTGVFTSAIVAERAGHKIALFVTGNQHAGENLADVLAHRAKSLAAPIQMCDALSRNLPGALLTIVAHCIAHARRKFVDVVNDFPDEVGHLLEALKQVYKNDALARQRGLGPDERLRFHQAESKPVMEDLEKWLRAQIDDRRVEPNSGLGEAIGYTLKHWSKLTLFLRVAGAPLDNNICERALKKAILHRKNALFFKTKNGARVGDLFMSLIHTAELNRENPFEYLVALQRHASEVAADPDEWMPWNYQATVARLAAERAAPG